jgi:hypothetical protein
MAHFDIWSTLINWVRQNRKLFSCYLFKSYFFAQRWRLRRGRSEYGRACTHLRERKKAPSVELLPVGNGNIYWKKIPSTQRCTHTRTHATDYKGARVVYMEILLPRTNTVRNKNGSLLDCYLFIHAHIAILCMRARPMEGSRESPFALAMAAGDFCVTFSHSVPICWYFQAEGGKLIKRYDLCTKWNCTERDVFWFRFFTRETRVLQMQHNFSFRL